MYNISRYNYYIQTILDIIAFLIGFLIARFVKVFFPLGSTIASFTIYFNLLLFVIVAYTIVDAMILAREDILDKNFSDEIKSSFKTTGIVMILLIGYLFITKTSDNFSREFIVLFWLFSFVFVVLLRTFMRKLLLPTFQKSKNSEQVLLLGSKDNVQGIIEKIKSSNEWRYKISGVCLTDDSNDDYIDGIKVIGNDNLMENILKTAADSVFIVDDIKDFKYKEIIRALNDLGKITHVNIKEYEILEESNRYVDEIGGSVVVSYLPFTKLPKRHAFIKRVFDFLIAVILLPIYLFLYLLTFVFNNLESFGPTIYKRVRVGKNGRRFYENRFRVLRMDAQERIDNNKSPFTIWGRFLKALHLNGLPEVINVLSGDMSFCGPHAPTVNRFLEYSSERRKNLCILPGIVGRWSVEKSEEIIIRKEREYLTNWTFLRDIEIYFEAALRYVFFHSIRNYDENTLNEEIYYINEYLADNKPLEFDRSAYKAKHKYLYEFVKRVIDIILSTGGIIALSPILIILALAVIFDDGGNPIYGHTRIGKNGKKIKLYKFRSMRVDAGDLKKLLTPEQLEQYQREFKIDNDPRITKVGEFIRKTSLDELPQLFNILKGDISIVGPRPIVEEETKIYGKDIVKFLSVVPGLTGYWQAYARNNATYESGERQEMEMYYVDNRSLWLDIKIFFKTFSSVLKKEGAQ